MTITAALPDTVVTNIPMGNAAADGITNSGDFSGALKSMMDSPRNGGPQTENAKSAQIKDSTEGGTAIVQDSMISLYSGYAQSELISMMLTQAEQDLTKLADFSDIALDAASVNMDLSFDGETGMDVSLMPDNGKSDSEAFKADLDGFTADIAPVSAGASDSTEKQIVSDNAENGTFTVPTDDMQTAVSASTEQTVHIEAVTLSDSNTDKTVRRAEQTAVNAEKVQLQPKEPVADNQSVDIADTKAVQVTSSRTERTASDFKADNQTEPLSDGMQPLQRPSENSLTFRRIEEKSSEALQLARRINGTKSDSDLNAQQKITEKQGTQQSIFDGNTEKSVLSDISAEEKPVVFKRMTVSEVYSFISEKSAGAGKSEFTVELTPQALGKITVKLINEGGKLSVEILTETAAAKQLFEANADRLAYNLRQNDVELQSYKVDTENQQLFNESFDGSSKNPYRQQQENQKQDGGEFEQLFDEIVNMS